MWLKLLHSDWLAGSPERWRQENLHLPSPPGLQCSSGHPVVSRIFPTLPLRGRQSLLLAGAGRSQQIRMEEWSPRSFPHFSDSASPGPAESPIGWSGPLTTNQNGGDPYPYDDETGQEGHMWLTISDFFLYFFKVLHIVEIYTLWRNTWR
jgi:hypothetical protein